MERKEVIRFIKAMRNPEKRIYAYHYLGYLEQRVQAEPSWGTLSYMAAQAVRITLHKYKGRPDYIC